MRKSLKLPVSESRSVMGWRCRNSLHSLSDGTIASLTYSAVIFWLSSSVNFFFLGVADPEAGVRIGGLGRKPEASVGSGLLRGVWKCKTGYTHYHAQLSSLNTLSYQRMLR